MDLNFTFKLNRVVPTYVDQMHPRRSLKGIELSMEDKVHRFFYRNMFPYFHTRINYSYV